MRKLFLLQGLPGSGKSTLLSQEGLQNYTISSDKLRLLLASPQLQPDGALKISQKQGGRVWRLLFEILEHRMQEGATSFVDATHLSPSSLQPYRKLAEKYGYKVYLLSLAVVPFATCMARNAAREELQRVPLSVMQEFCEALQKFIAPEWVEVISAEALRFALLPPTLDLSQESWQHVHFIGDVHGFHLPLKAALSSIDIESSLLVFTGDLLGEGPDNAAVFKTVADLLARGQALVCEGYMERQLRRHLSDRSARSEVFQEIVRPQLLQAEISLDELLAFQGRLHELLYLDLSPGSILVTHGGLPKPLDAQQLGLLSADDLILGSGDLNTSVDENFGSYAQAGQWQVHAHRNPGGLEPDAVPQSYNLTRMGGELKTLSFCLASKSGSISSFGV